MPTTPMIEEVKRDKDTDELAQWGLSDRPPEPSVINDADTQ